LLSAHRKELDALVEALLSRETLNEQEVLKVTGPLRPLWKPFAWRLLMWTVGSLFLANLASALCFMFIHLI